MYEGNTIFGDGGVIVIIQMALHMMYQSCLLNLVLG
jgi:hypothetical protein